jgi:hypothetical protein
MGRIGSTLSVFDVDHIGSTLSMRGFSRLGSAIAVMDFANLGSSLSLRSFARLGSGFHVTDKLYTSNVKTSYIYHDSSELKFYAYGSRAMTATSSGGTLHGVWTADVSISTSDRRLKDNIKPLYQTLQETSHKLASGWSSSSQEEDTMTGWILREMRPVSYTFKKGPDSKSVRLGFIAQEVEKVLPSVAPTIPDEQQTKGVDYMDLIAVLTNALKELQEGIKTITPRMLSIEDRVRQRRERKRKKQRASKGSK